MDNLRIPLTAITETGVTIQALVPVAQLQPEGAEPIPAKAVTVYGVLQEIDGEYLFDGLISGAFEHACDRCLDPVSQPFEAAVLWNYQPGPAAASTDEIAEEALEDRDVDDEQLNTFPFEGNEIDLAPQVWEELVLAAPAKYLCRPDCAGLCPHCGINLNHETCACPKDETMAHKGLAGLADLLPQLKDKPPKE